MHPEKEVIAVSSIGRSRTLEQLTTREVRRRGLVPIGPPLIVLHTSGGTSEHRSFTLYGSETSIPEDAVAYVVGRGEWSKQELLGMYTPLQFYGKKEVS